MPNRPPINSKKSKPIISKPITSKPARSKRIRDIWDRSFSVQVLHVWRSVFQDKGVLSMLLIAPIIYGFFYPWPYSQEVVRHVPVAVIDYDHSSLSQTIISYAQANPRIQSTVVSDENQAKQLMWQGKIAGYMVIPFGLYQKVVTGQPAKVSILANGNYFLLNKQVQTGFLEVIGTVSAGTKIQKNVAIGQDISVAKSTISPVALTINPLYNRTEGYGSTVVPSVSILILQQMFLMGTAMLVGTWVEQDLHRVAIKTWLARIFALSCFGFVLGCFYYGWVFANNDYARNQNLSGSMVLLAVFFPAVTALGCLFGIWFGARERAMQILVASSMPMLFVSGVSWPYQMLPEPLQYLRWLLPSTSGMNASVMLNQMGVPLSDVKVYLLALVMIFLVCLLLLLLLASEESETL